MYIYTIYIYIGFPVSNGFILNYPPGLSSAMIRLLRPRARVWPWDNSHGFYPGYHNLSTDIFFIACWLNTYAVLMASCSIGDNFIWQPYPFFHKNLNGFYIAFCFSYHDEIGQLAFCANTVFFQTRIIFFGYLVGGQWENFFDMRF